MKIIQTNVPVLTIEEFADQNDLVMAVDERPVPVGDLARFYARFKSTDIKTNGGLLGVFGNGATQEDAIADYGQRIALETLVVDAFQKTRREIRVPRIVEKGQP